MKVGAVVASRFRAYLERVPDVARILSLAAAWDV
jgi:hypothetical protein